MVWSQEEIAAFKARLVNAEGDAGKVDDFLPGSGQESFVSSPRGRSSTSSDRFRSKATPTSVNDDWIGGGSPTGKKRSWKAKSIKAVIPDPDLNKE
mmetsp:Transcript_144303/g.204059  ORF Transcript_144303/g.204059 Transcript_144303/m.204059 type:complete len:96 (-) Transcript_144303:210-497(-)